MALIKYDKGSNLTKNLSEVCKIRIIWGSDETITTVLSNPKNIRCKDLVFPSRISWAVISTKLILEQTYKLSELANAFFDDTFSLDQNACSSPSQVFFLRDGLQVENAKELFWNAVKDVMLERNYEVSEAMVMNREVACVSAAMISPGCKINRNYLPFFHLFQT